jgi:oxygen-independent coproporphyrinogen-3 oxidase
MVKELILRKEYLQEPLQTIYFGGGTPSLLQCHEIDLLFTTIHQHYLVAPDAEITLEANPDDLSPSKLKELRSAGINRLSIGIQSFDDVVLSFLHRGHDARSARKCLEHAQAAGFTNFSIDLIYAIPGLTDNKWDETLMEALRFTPAHISTYALTIEDRTVFGTMSKRGKLHPVEEESAARQFERVMELLTGAGYEHYEISNFCKPGAISQHNSSYWRQSAYLGIGPSAHSYDHVSRQFNVRNNALYMRSLQQGVIPFEREVLSQVNIINEYILTTLRTQWGCDLKVLQHSFGDPLLKRKGEYIAQLQQQGLVHLQESTLLLTRAGKLLADKIAEDLMVGD